MRIGEIIEVGHVEPHEVPMTPVAVPENPEPAVEPTPFAPERSPEFVPEEVEVEALLASL